MNKAMRILIIAAGLCFASAGMAAAQNVTLVRGLSFYNLEVGATGGFSFDVGAGVSEPGASASLLLAPTAPTLAVSRALRREVPGQSGPAL
jgi:hypothetical protein